jgi:hypothetical protein
LGKKGIVPLSFLGFKVVGAVGVVRLCEVLQRVMGARRWGWRGCEWGWK